MRGPSPVAVVLSPRVQSLLQRLRSRLTANLEIWCGRIIAPTLGTTRTEVDFVGHVKQTVEMDPWAGWVFIVDNLNTHQSESLVLYVAETCEIKQRPG